MIDKVSTAHSKIKINQCLFGYQDGHRLLASSLKLTEEASSILLLLSDLASGLSMTANGSYWTGIPLPSEKSYALMRTWLAPEMPRPGCVWTHALIVAFSDIARFPDLSVLVEHLARPNTESGFEMYCEPILLALPPGEVSLRKEAVGFDAVDAHRVIQAIYADNGTGTVVAPLGALDALIFSIWSQQWPKLRRSFSFRTASGSSHSHSNTSRFDLTVLLRPEVDQISLFDCDTNDIDAWEMACVDDLLFPKSTELRRFLWRYGSDVRFGRKRFKFLVNVYLWTRSTRLVGKDLHKILVNVSKVLSSPEDGKVLKEDLVGRNRYSLLPSIDSIDMLAFYVNAPIAEKLPTPSAIGLEEILRSWPERAEEILSIAETAAEGVTELGTQLLERLMDVIDASSFLSSTVTRPNLRNKMLLSNPSLLDCDALVNMPSAEIVRLIKYVPDDNHALIDRILLRLIKIDDINLAENMVQRFPYSAVSIVIRAIESLFVGDGTTTVHLSWVKAVSTQSSIILHGGYIERSRTTSALAFMASMLGYDQPEILEAGSMPWVTGLKNAKDDIDGAGRQRLLVFLLKLALHKPVSGCEPLFEIAFDAVHSYLKYSQLDWEQTSQLQQYLPNLNWFKNWDNCLRLKTGIVDAYAKCNLNPMSFKRLTTNANLYDELIELADDSKAGRKFLKQLI